MKSVKSPINCLGLEGTAHTFGAGIMNDEGEILSNVWDEYIPLKGGIHPREAARHHVAVIKRVIGEAIKKAGISIREINVVAFSQGPGLGPCLRTTATAARALSLLLKVPLVGVNHCVAHVEIGKLATGAKDPVTLYVSGGNTIVTAFDEGRYRVFGETLDIAIGNMLDVFAREIGLQHPGGAKIERLAKEGKKFIPLPYTVKGMDLSYSGLLTAALSKKEECRMEELCYSLQEVAFSMLAEVTERAVAHTGKKEVLLTGGVGRNKRLQEMLQVISCEHDASFYVVPESLAGDNGAMIAWTGLLAYKSGQTLSIEESFIRPKWRLDEVDVTWI